MPPISSYIHYKSWRPKGLFQFEIIINVLVNSFRFIWIPMLWVYAIKNISYSAGIDLRRQNLTSTLRVTRRESRIHYVLRALCLECIVSWMHCILNALCIKCIVYWIHCVLNALYIACIVSWMHCVLNALLLECIMSWGHCVLNALCIKCIVY